MIAQFPALAARLRAAIPAAAQAPDCRPGSAAGDGVQFNRLALDLFARQFAANAPYRALCRARQAIPGRIDRRAHV